MSISIVRDILEGELESFWNNRTPLIFDNVDYLPKPGESIIRSTVSQYNSKSKFLGCSEGFYTFTVQVLIPYNDRNDITFADDIYNHFLSFRSGHLQCQDGYIDRIGKTNQWFQLNVVNDVRYYNFT